MSENLVTVIIRCPAPLVNSTHKHKEATVRRDFPPSRKVRTSSRRDSYCKDINEATLAALQDFNRAVPDNYRGKASKT